MSFLERAIKRGVSNAVSSAVEQGVKKAVAPRVEQAAANVTNKAADSFNRAVGIDDSAYAQNARQPSYGGASVNTESVNAAASTLGGIFGAYQGAAMNFANEAAKNMKICPSCGVGADASKKFCPSCGTKLPETTVAEGALCASCGTQNSVGTKFCASCGAKLPAMLAQEQAAAAADAAVMAKWDALLPQYPRWNGGGRNFEIEEMGVGDDGAPSYIFYAEGTNSGDVDAYRRLLGEYGFVQAGKYKSASMLYKMVNGVCYCFESAEPFASDRMSVGFCVNEPEGGFNYVPPEKKSGLDELKSGLKGLKGLFG